jgi:hypothetical protein
MGALRGRPCAVYSSELRVRIRATGLMTYPHLSIVCTFEVDDVYRDPLTAVGAGGAG